MGTSFKELGGSPIETFNREGGMKAERRLLVDWDDRHALVAELLGSSYEFGGTKAAEYPDYPIVVATSCKIEPWPGTPDEQASFTDVESDINTYSDLTVGGDTKLARIIVQYEVLSSNPFDDPSGLEEDTFLTYRMDVGGEYIDQPGADLTWEAQPGVKVPEESVAVLRVPVIEHHFTWHRVLKPPWTTIREQVGTVNNADIFGIPAGRLLFEGAPSDRDFTGVDEFKNPEFGWRLSYLFREKNIIKRDGTKVGWQYNYRPDDGAIAGDWDRLLDSDGNPRHWEADHNDLFKYEAKE